MEGQNLFTLCACLFRRYSNYFVFTFAGLLRTSVISRVRHSVKFKMAFGSLVPWKQARLSQRDDLVVLRRNSVTRVINAKKKKLAEKDQQVNSK